jgi:hypothetical protein
MFGFAYLYGSSTLTVDATHVRILNPLRRVTIPLVHVSSAVARSNLEVVTEYKHFFAWGVEAANVQLAVAEFGTQSDVAELITEAAQVATNGADPQAPYRFAMPDLFFWFVALVYAVCLAHEVTLN